MVKIKRLIIEVPYSVAITIVYLLLYMLVLPYVFSKILGYSEEFFLSLTYIVLALMNTGLSIASRYVVRPVKIVINLLSSVLSILILLYVTNNGVFEFRTSYETYTLIMSLDFSIVLYVIMIAILALSVISAITTSKK